MKTQVIQLAPHDDITSVRDKMSWAKAPRILLVFPHHSRILSRTLDLRLLRRHATTLGAQLAIVARSGDLRRTAQAVDIPVFNTVAIAHHKTWEEQHLAEKPRRRAPRPDLRQMRRAAFPAEARWRTRFVLRFSFFSLAVLAVLTLLLLFLPSASIKLTPETHQQSLTVAVSASPEVTTVNLTGSIPARLIFTTLERSKTAAVSGSITIPDSPAAGIVRFRNLTTGAVGIPAGTVIRTTSDPPVRFATTTDASMAAGVDKTLDVAVRAVKGGTSGNLPADSLVAIEGDLGASFSLAVTNPGPLAGGSDRTAPAQTADDRTRLHDALLSEILEECKTALPKTLVSGDVYFPDTLAVGQLLSETYFPAKGQTGETLSLTMNLQCQAQYASAADINTLAEMALDANLPDEFIPTSGGVTTPVAGVPKTDTDGITRWEMQPQRLLRAHLDPLAVTQLALGRRPVQAARRLSESFPLASVPEIQVKPSWWPWMPIVLLRITISTGD
jgi:hypothetical protein